MVDTALPPAAVETPVAAGPATEVAAAPTSATANIGSFTQIVAAPATPEAVAPPAEIPAAAEDPNTVPVVIGTFSEVGGEPTGVVETAPGVVAPSASLVSSAVAAPTDAAVGAPGAPAQAGFFTLTGQSTGVSGAVVPTEAAPTEVAAPTEAAVTAVAPPSAVASGPAFPFTNSTAVVDGAGVSATLQPLPGVASGTGGDALAPLPTESSTGDNGGLRQLPGLANNATGPGGAGTLRPLPGVNGTIPGGVASGTLQPLPGATDAASSSGLILDGVGATGTGLSSLAPLATGVGAGSSLTTLVTVSNGATITTVATVSAAALQSGSGTAAAGSTTATDAADVVSGAMRASGNNMNTVLVAGLVGAAGVLGVLLL